MKEQDLFAIAHVGHRYLLEGSYELATSIFEGLFALAPRHAYFALALGLARDRSGDRLGAHRMYATASRLDPTDPRPDVNRAELFLESGDVERARALLARAVAKRGGDAMLRAKAEALFAHVRRIGRPDSG
jgi:Flp pilus assembly protein TadD